MGDQFRQVRAQGGFTAGQEHMRDPGRSGLIQDAFPFLGGQFAFDAFHRGGILAGALGPVGQGAIQPQRRRQLDRVGFQTLEIQIGFRFEIGCI